MVALDRFFISPEWEERFPLCVAWSLTRVGSDHSPIVLDSGEQGAPRPRYFFFEKQWLKQLDLWGLVKKKWEESVARRPANSYSLDNWHGSLCYLRQALKGWNLQKIGEQKKKKKELLQQPSDIDSLADRMDLSAEQWQSRYEIEAKLESIYNMEEIYWQQRGSARWVLEGDTNSKFFHLYANGRRRKKTIISLDTNQGVVSTQGEIMSHVTEFYKSLFRPGGDCNLKLADKFWADRYIISEEERKTITRPFQEAEVKQMIFDMKIDSSPGPNGFSVHFFKTFWPIIKGDYMAMVQDFHKGALDTKTLNYGVITLVPKIREANNIKQYRPVCLLNIDFKGITKILNNRLSPMAKEVIGDNQTGFIKGRNILEGVLTLHEVIHELKK